MSTVSNYLPVFSDYTIQLKVMKDSNQKWQSPIIEVDGTEANWVSAVSGSQTGTSDRWLAIPGTGFDPNTGTVEILKREDFFDDDWMLHLPSRCHKRILCRQHCRPHEQQFLGTQLGRPRCKRQHADLLIPSMLENGQSLMDCLQ